MGRISRQRGLVEFYVPCIYLRARRQLPQAVQVSVVVPLVVRVTSQGGCKLSV